MRRVAPLVLVTAALALSACGDDGAQPAGGPVAGEHDAPEHIHGIGINPSDGALIIATHTGLFRAAENEDEARRIGDRRQDTMGFTVVGADRFLGSGHPDLRDDLPPLLGLIRSQDAGRTWQPVSLLGEADFHVLRAIGDLVYGYDSANGRFMTSRDAGRTWSQHRPPAPVIDLAIHPIDARRIVASTPDGLHGSRDAGRTWRPLARAPGPGLLAWPRRDALVLTDARGEVHRSADGGRAFAAAGRLPGPPAAIATAGRSVIAATHDNAVYVSRDAGATWTRRLAPGAGRGA